MQRASQFDYTAERVSYLRIYALKLSYYLAKVLPGSGDSTSG